MKFFKVLFISVLVLLTGSLHAANTVTTSSGNMIVEITSIDSDWTYTDTLGGTGRMSLESIQFIPGAADDQCVILDGDASGAKIFDVIAIDSYDSKVKYFNSDRALYKPFLDYSEGTYSSGSTVILIFGK